ncbi:ead/Ea22-like family protein [Serratia marcescens]|uniref:ead/Ea22-like family protein n=1 Tax=Serratia marcescens TaxID=615 RepID=UPI003204CCF6
MDKFSELKAAALAATPGPWILDDDSWSEGDNANVSTEERYDGRVVSIAQIEGGGSESGFDEPFSAEQQANARYITAANPAVIVALLAELEAKDKRITGLERHVKDLEATLIAATDEVADLTKERNEARARLATPVRLPETYSPDPWMGPDPSGTWLDKEDVKAAIRAPGFTVEGDE